VLIILNMAIERQEVRYSQMFITNLKGTIQPENFVRLFLRLASRHVANITAADSVIVI
jgi:hypothetical protein